MTLTIHRWNENMRLNNYQIAIEQIAEELGLPSNCPPALVVRTVCEQAAAYRRLQKAATKALEENVALRQGSHGAVANIIP